LTHDSRLDSSESGSVHFELPLHTPLPGFRDGFSGPDWSDWFERWDWQQSSYIPGREERFAFMLDVLEAVCGDEFTMIDLMCGPGAISKRVTERFPKAKVIAIDLDPVLMEMGRRAVGDAGGRIAWHERDFRDQNWWPSIGHAGPVDAVLSTTAIHWLHAGGIVDLYRQLADIIRPGGLFLDGDAMEYEAAKPTIRRISQEQRANFRSHAGELGAESWEEWWLNLRKEPGVAELMAERDRRFSWRGTQAEAVIGAARSDDVPVMRHTHYEVHRAALLDAGFSEVDVVWQKLSNRVLAAIR
jgi:SAM-dependent methyltransferase